MLSILSTHWPTLLYFHLSKWLLFYLLLNLLQMHFLYGRADWMKSKRFYFWSDKESCKVNIVRVRVQKFCHWVTWLQRIDLARCHCNIFQHFSWFPKRNLPMTATENIQRKSLSRTMATNFQSSFALLFSISSFVKAAMYLTLWIALFSSGHLSPNTSTLTSVSVCFVQWMQFNHFHSLACLQIDWVLVKRHEMTER